MQTNKHEEIKVLTTMLFDKFKSLALSTDETAQVVKRSKISLDRDRAEGVGIPCSKLGKGIGSDRVRYSVYDVARFIVNRKMQVMS